MSDSFDFSEIYNFKFKKSKFIFPLNYLKDILNGITKLFYPKNIMSEMKNSPLNLFNRTFGSQSRRHIFNVLVLIADLESNVGAACIELLNENPENLKNFHFRQNIHHDDNLYVDDNFYIQSIDTQIFNNDNYYDYSVIDNNMDNIKEESKILEANLCNYESIDNHINPEYLLQDSISSDYSIPLLNEANPKEIKQESSEDFNCEGYVDLKSWDWNSFDTSSFTEASNCENSCEEFGDKENTFSDCESDYSLNCSVDKNYTDNLTSLPKPIKREIYHLKMLGVPFDYYDITQSSHEVFKAMKNKADLTKTQISAMTNARRRYINRRAATRCRTQKLQQKDQLKQELKRLQNQLIEKKITLTKSYQQRNEMRDQFRIVQRNLVIKLKGPDEEALNPKKWSTELADNKSLILIENIRSS